MPPDEDALLDRLRTRGREDEATIERRFAEARSEMATARECGAYDAFIVNDDLERATTELVASIRAHGHKDVRALDTLDTLPDIIRDIAQPGDMIVCLGAGNITQWAHDLPAQLRARRAGREEVANGVG